MNGEGNVWMTFGSDGMGVDAEGNAGSEFGSTLG